MLLDPRESVIHGGQGDQQKVAIADSKRYVGRRSSLGQETHLRRHGSFLHICGLLVWVWVCAGVWNRDIGYASGRRAPVDSPIGPCYTNAGWEKAETYRGEPAARG